MTENDKNVDVDPSNSDSNPPDIQVSTFIFYENEQIFASSRSCSVSITTSCNYKKNQFVFGRFQVFALTISCPNHNKKC